MNLSHDHCRSLSLSAITLGLKYFVVSDSAESTEMEKGIMGAKESEDKNGLLMFGRTT